MISDGAGPQDFSVRASLEMTTLAHIRYPKTLP